MLCLPLVVAAGCTEEAAVSYEPTYGDATTLETTLFIFGVHPLHNPATLHQVYGPLVQYLNARLDTARLRLEASRDYADYERKLAGRHFHFALPNPYQTLKSLRYGYEIFGKMGDDDQFRGIILVRKDQLTASPLDLRGKAVSYPAPTALAATMMPQALLFREGLNVQQDLDNRYVGSQESSILNVYFGHTAAGATWPPPWRKFQQDEPDKAAQLMVRWQTEPLPNNGLVVRDDVPAALRDAVARLLFSLHESEEGRALLARMPLSRFEAADQATYAPTRDFLTWFNTSVRPVEMP
ncbi:MAG: phosphonate ABC transporter substrate-binding protein [Desulfobulbaceae bacterium A2]|nr:MAG: phosphonate ABC transporter substrate-binding protein [Desulfobulbaceae bacterium A2]